LQKRLRKPTQQGLVRAKTGTMTGIMSLSGYLYTNNAHTLAFVIFINTKPGTKPAISGRYRSLVDSLCDFFLAQTPDNRMLSRTRNPHARVAFQQNPNHADQQRNRQARWRRLEFALKKGLSNQATTVLFRPDQLVLIDHGNDLNGVWSVLQNLSKQYAFSVALQSPSSPTSNLQKPHLLWINADNTPQSPRIWTVRESNG
jgi:D-alanyl-D-alanine carboxypeptidase/D-alanyl-D-alanine-endopeptidase (penicillin-binding protein 4)